MKYLVLIPDGMADERVPALSNKTPMQAASKPTMDLLAKSATVGTVSNVPVGMVPESDTANMAILSFDPKVYSKGRSPLEATSMGLSMTAEDTAIRCNLVTLTDCGEAYEEKTILDHSAGEITTEEADLLIHALEETFGNDTLHFYTGVSYRHCILWKNADEHYSFARPHDHLGECIRDYLPKEDNGGKEFLEIMRASFELLNHHPVNEARRARGLRPANSIWLWSPGKKPFLPSFKDKWGLNGTVISAVDLIKGIGICADMQVVNVDGATGNVRTNYCGKATAAIDAFKNGSDLVYVHVEAPDECGHDGDTELKVKSIERIDEEILGPVKEYLDGCGEEYRILLTPDHPTPIEERTHVIEPVPYVIYGAGIEDKSGLSYNEENGEKTGKFIPFAYTIMKRFIKGE